MRRFRRLSLYGIVVPSSTTPPQDFADRLRLVRERKGLSQAELADKAGLQPSAISHFETGRRAPSFENLRALADALSVSTDYLLGRQQEPTAAGPAAEKMFRHLSRMSDADQTLLEEFAKTLARKNKEKEKDKS